MSIGRIGGREAREIDGSHDGREDSRRFVARLRGGRLGSGIAYAADGATGKGLAPLLASLPKRSSVVAQAPAPGTGDDPSSASARDARVRRAFSCACASAGRDDAALNALC